MIEIITRKIREEMGKMMKIIMVDEGGHKENDGDHEENDEDHEGDDADHDEDEGRHEENDDMTFLHNKSTSLACIHSLRFFVSLKLVSNNSIHVIAVTGMNQSR